MKKEWKFYKYRWILITLIPIIAMVTIMQFRRILMPTNEEILKYIRNAKGYTCDIEYVIINSRGEYTDNVIADYNKGVGGSLIFQDNRKKLYKEDIISITENNSEYNTDYNSDILYPLGFVNKVLDGDIVSINEDMEEWGDIKYLEVNVNLDNKNNHMKSLKVYINKKDKTPILIKVYDKDNCEKVTIKIKDFKYSN